MAVHRPRGVHLVGSVPLANEAEVFRTVGSILGEHALRIPDGETGARTNWIGWQFQVMQDNPALEFVPPEPGTDPYANRPPFKRRAGAGEVAFDRLGYADAAKSSYATFAR